MIPCCEGKDRRQLAFFARFFLTKNGRVAYDIPVDGIYDIDE